MSARSYKISSSAAQAGHRASPGQSSSPSIWQVPVQTGSLRFDQWLWFPGRFGLWAWRQSFCHCWCARYAVQLSPSLVLDSSTQIWAFHCMAELPLQTHRSQVSASPRSKPHSTAASSVQRLHQAGICAALLQQQKAGAHLQGAVIRHRPHIDRKGPGPPKHCPVRGSRLGWKCSTSLAGPQPCSWPPQRRSKAFRETRQTCQGPACRPNIL